MINRIKQWFQFPPGLISQDDIDVMENNEQSSENDLSSIETQTTLENKIVPQVKDADLEYLFHQLLEGIVNGWQEKRVAQFLQKLEPKVSEEAWLKWLQRYRSQLLASPSPHYQLAERMKLLGKLKSTSSIPFVKAIASSVDEISQELFNRRIHLFTGDYFSLSNTRETNSLVSDYQIQEDAQFSPLSNPNTILGNIISLLQKNPLLKFDNDKALEQEDLVDPAMIMAQIDQETSSDTKPLLITEANDSLSAEDIFGIALEKAQAGDLEKALSLWQEVVTLDPDFAPAWHNLGSAYAYFNRLPEAIESFDNALAINVNDYLSWNDRGNALFRLERCHEAIISWDRVIGIKPDFEQAWYHRGLALEKLEEYADAMISYKKCLSINPEFSQAKKRYQKIRLRTVIVRAGKRKKARGKR